MGSILKMQTLRLSEESSGPRVASLLLQSAFSNRNPSPHAISGPTPENDTLLLFGMRGLSQAGEEGGAVA